MNRIEFMDRLERLLADLPESERGEAVQYYNDYLDDAGVENEQEVLDALGTPEQLAVSIREGLKEDSAELGEFSERGYTDRAQESDVEFHLSQERRGSTDGRCGESDNGRIDERQNNRYRTFAGDRYRTSANDRYRSSAGEHRSARRTGRGRTGMSTGALILVIICCICAAPVILPLAFALLVVVIALAAAAVVVALALLFSGVVCIAAGLWALFAAVVKLFVVPAGAMMAVGISLTTIGVGILLVLGMGWIMGRFFPKAFRGCVNFCSRIFKRKGGKGA